jgi:DNA-binding transcriptional regulator/RsmH inhibitor MraZ
VLVGQGNYFEIWSPSEWALQQQALSEPEANSERFKVLDLSTSTG